MKASLILKKRHLLPVLIIITLNTVLWSGIITTDGVIISGDFNFPVRSENFERYYFPTWNDLSSQTNLERLPRLVMLSPFVALAAAGIEISAVPKVLLIFTYTLASLSMYFFLSSIERHFGLDNRLGKVGKYLPILGALVFAYNPVSLQFAGGISILYSIGALPLLLYVILTRIDSKYFPFFIAGIMLLSLGHPFTLLFNALIGQGFMLLVHWKGFNLKFIVSKIAFPTLTFILLFAWYWIPYAAYPVQSVELGRAQNLERSMFDVISNNDPADIVLLERDRFLYVNTNPSDPVSGAIHYFSLSLLLVTGISSMLVLRSRDALKIVVFLVLGFVLAALLAMGTKGPFGESYFAMVSESNIGWTFRSPLKFQLYESFFASALFGIGLTLLSFRFKRNLAIMIAASLILTGISAHGIYDANTNSLKPILLPTEYYEISEILAERYDGHKVMYYPIYPGSRTNWSEGHGIGTFDMKSSVIPTFETSANYNYIKEMLEQPYRQEIFRSYNFYDYLSSIGIRYIVFHNDRGQAIDNQNLDYLLRSHQLELLYNKNDWYLFELKTAITKPIDTITSLLVVEDQQQIIKASKARVGTITDPTLVKNKELLNFGVSNNNSQLMVQDSNQVISEFDLRHNFQKNWQSLNNGFDMILVRDSITQKDTLMLSTDNIQRGWSWLTSDPIDLKQGDAILLSMKMKTENVQGTHVKVSGFFESEGIWKDIAFLAIGINGNSDWQYYWAVVQGTSDIAQIRYVINAGTVLEQSNGSAITSITDFGAYNLSTGNQGTQIIEYEKISPTEWRSRVKADGPFVMTFAETYDPRWFAIVDGQEINSIMLNGAVNGFPIDRVGEYEVIVQYKPQGLFNIGAIISGIFLMAVIGYFCIFEVPIYSWKRALRLILLRK